MHDWIYWLSKWDLLGMALLAALVVYLGWLWREETARIPSIHRRMVPCARSGRHASLAFETRREGATDGGRYAEVVSCSVWKDQPGWTCQQECLDGLNGPTQPA
jgi:hypothetical protein